MDHKSTEGRTCRIRVLIAGPFMLFDAALGTLLAGLPGVEPAGQTADLAAVTVALPDNPPDLVLLTFPRPTDLERCSPCP